MGKSVFRYVLLLISLVIDVTLWATEFPSDYYHLFIVHFDVTLWATCITSV
jgi:hypothetical protein